VGKSGQVNELMILMVLGGIFVTNVYLGCFTNQPEEENLGR